MSTASCLFAGWLWFSAAAAADADRHPYQAAVTAEPRGVSRVDVPLVMRRPDRPRDGSDLLLVDASGEPVPFAVLDTVPTPEQVYARRGAPNLPGELLWWPDPDADGTVFIVQVAERPLDALVVELPRVPSAADVTLWIEGQPEPLLTQRIFRFADDDRAELPLPPVLGQFRVDVDLLDPTPLDVVAFAGLRYPEGRPAWTTLELDLGPPMVQENGWVRYDLPLPTPVPIEYLELDAEGDLFDRQAEVVQRPYDEGRPDTLPTEPSAYNPQRIQRIAIGDASLNHTRLAVSPDVTDPVLLISGPPLPVPRARIRTRAWTLLIRDPGTRALTLYGGGDESRGSNDLQHAARELARAASGDAAVGEVVPNPTVTLAPERDGLLVTGAEVDDGRFRWARAVTGEGLVRIPLDRHVLTHARPDLGDLRLLDPSGRQVPYVLRASGTRSHVADLSFERRETGASTHIDVAMPEAGLPVESLTLRSPASGFVREVSLLQPVRSRLVDLRRTTWRGTDSSVLSLGVGRRAAERLVVRIDNGDDSPIPVDSIDVTWQNWELVAWLPGPTRLVYGDDALDAPVYDLHRHRLPLASAATASLADPKRWTGAPAPFIEQAAVVGGIAAVAFGLLVLFGLIVRGAPAEAAAAADDDANTPPDPQPDPPADPRPAPAQE